MRPGARYRVSDVSKAGRRRNTRASRIILGEEGETVRHMEKVFALLLDFATLPEKSRRDFLARINEFLIMSPLQKRQAIDEWKLVAEHRRDESGQDPGGP